MSADKVIGIIGITFNFIGILIDCLIIAVLKLTNKNAHGSQIKMSGQFLLQFMILSDLFRSLACCLGLVRYEVEWTGGLSFYFCIFQSFLLVVGMISSSAWILVIGFFYYSRLFNASELNKNRDTFRFKKVCHLVCWGGAIFMAVLTLVQHRLGEDEQQAVTAGWCWIDTKNKTMSEQMLWWTVTGHGEELVSILCCILIYIKYKVGLYMRNKNLLRENNENEISTEVESSSGSERRNYGSMNTQESGNHSYAFSRTYAGLQQKVYEKLPFHEEKNLFAILILCFYLGRMWGILRFILAPFETANKASHVLGYVQGISDFLQALLNLLAVIITSDQARDMMGFIFCGFLKRQ